MDRPHNTAIVRINSDLPCQIFWFGREIGRANIHDYTEIYLPKGKHRLSFVSSENTNDRVDLEKEILDVEYEDIIDVYIYPIKNARIAKERAERERREQIRREQIRREEERLAELRRQEEEKRKREEAMKPYKIAPYLSLNFYDSVRVCNLGYSKPKKYFIASKNGLYSFLDDSFLPIIPFQFEQIQISYFGSDNPKWYIFASKDGLYSVLNDSFLPTIPFQFEQIQECNGNGDYLWVKVNKKWGLYNYKQRQYIVSPRFDEIFRTGNYANCYTLQVTIGDRWNGGSYKLGVINDKGELFIDCKYEELSETYVGDFKAKLNGMEGLLDKYGRVKLNFVYEHLYLGGKLPTIYRGKYGVFSHSGTVILDFIYDEIKYREPFGCGYHVLVKDGKYGIHICATNEMIPCEYNSEEEIPNFYLKPYR